MLPLFTIDERGSTVSACEKVITSAHEKAITSAHWKGDCLCWSWGVDEMMQRGSTVNFHMENSKDLTYFSCMLVLKLFTLLFTIDTERINSLCMWKGDCLCMWKGDHLCTWKGDPLDPGDQWLMHMRGSTVNFNMKNSKDLTYLWVGIETVYITVYNWCREDQQSTFTWKIQKI